jgi:hypothetical protein
LEIDNGGELPDLCCEAMAVKGWPYRLSNPMILSFFTFDYAQLLLVFYQFVLQLSSMMNREDCVFGSLSDQPHLLYYVLL